MSGYWVGEGKAKPVTKGAFTRTTLEPLKVANICIVTDELLRSSSPSAEMVIRDDLAAALRERLDIDFIDPSKSASAGVSPASVTYGAQAIAATSYTDADDVRLDVRSVMQYFINADNPPTTGVWVMSTGNALALSMLVNGLGQPEFSGIGMNGGQFFGLPVITSEHAGSYVTLVNASDIYLGDEGGISIDMSRSGHGGVYREPVADQQRRLPRGAHRELGASSGDFGCRSERRCLGRRGQLVLIVG
jgi:HK97 family phage major capsid protein